MSILNKKLTIWFITGSQHLYGPAAIEKVAKNAKIIAEALNQSSEIPASVIFKPVLTTPDAISKCLDDANRDPLCIGLIAWMHTFSPAKMWIHGLKLLRKPLLHLHTQFNRDLPWSEIDMDFMNLNQAAHGDREFGFICSRLRLRRKVVAGYWEDAETLREVGVWSRAAAAWHDWQGARFVRFGDNMRQVAVTEGDKVAAETRFGFSVNGYGVGDLVEKVKRVGSAEIDFLCQQYADTYTMSTDLKPGGPRHDSIREAARIELGLRAFLEEHEAKGFTTTFEDLHGLRQLPGLSVQRLMADGYGFGAEGDWKTAALLRAMKVMAADLEGGVSFMEDYTYHLHPSGQKVLGAHMLEICPTIASGQPSLEVHPLGIGDREDPARLVFDTPPGPAVNASIMDMGNRFRILVNRVNVVESDAPLPNLPVARALWVPQPDFKTATTAWILAGGAHHTGFSRSLGVEHLEDFADIAGLELLCIDSSTTVRSFRKELAWSEDHQAQPPAFY